MDAKSMTRKDFVILTFTLIGGGALGSACSSDNNNGGTGGSSGSGTGGSSGSGTGGSSGGGTGGAITGVTTTTCADPLHETELTNTSHIHSLVINASVLSQTTNQVITTGSAMDPGGVAHTHMVTITPAQLATLKGGGTATVTSTIALAGGGAHAHDFMVSCH